MQKRFLSGVFHQLEIEEFHKRDEGAPRLQYLASRWALKEALVKASGQTRLSYPGIFLHKEPPKEIIEKLSDGRDFSRKLKQKPMLSISGDLNHKLLI